MKTSAILASLIGLLVMTGAAQAATSVQSGAWSDPDTWGGSVPGVGADVTVVSGHSVTVDSDTAALNTLTSDGTLVFSGWENALTATEVTLNGTVTHPMQSATTTNAFGAWVPDNRVWIVCSNLTLNAAGKIDVTAKGYRGGGSSVSGCGPGRGINTGNGGTGAGHGGTGGQSAGSVLNGVAYGDPADPKQPGSGGGGWGTRANSGGHGGGAVRIDASGRVIVDGKVMAHGSASATALGGGGSGGAIRLACQTISGKGYLGANGANDTQSSAVVGGGSAGGRIALIYDTAAQEQVNQTDLPTLCLAANGGWAYTAAAVYENASATLGVKQCSAEPGTIYLSDAGFFPTPATEGGQIVIPGGLDVARDSLTISNGVLSLPPGSRLTLTNDLILSQNFGGLQMTNGVLDIGGDLVAQTVNYAFSYVRCATGDAFRVGGQMTVGNRYTFRLYGHEDADGGERTRVAIGNLVVTNAGRFCPYAGPTNGVVSDSYGMQLTIDNDAVVAANAALAPYTHPTNGAACRILLQNLTIQADGKLDAVGGGFAGGANYGVTYYKHNGYGPGNGINGWLGSGAGYGGAGGSISAAAPGGAAYGSVDLPLLPGSGAGGRNECDINPSRIGSAGGGLVWIEAAGRVTVNGIIAADAETNRDAFGGGGSGGGVYIVCQTLAASNGLISANGAPGKTDGPNHGGGGGGGRVALHYDPVAQAAWNAVAVPTLQITANHGPCWNNSTINRETYYPGQPGTIWLTDASFFPGPDLQGGTITIPGITRIERDSLTVFNSLAGFDGIDLVITNNLTLANNFAGLQTTNTTVTVGGDFRATCANYGFAYLHLPVGTALTVAGDWVITNRYTLRLYGDTDPTTVCTVGGDIVVSRTGGLHLYSGATNGVAPDYGLRIDVGGTIRTASSGWIYPYGHPLNGGTPLFRAHEVVIATNSGFNANLTGYPGGYYYSGMGNKGYDPGAGQTSGGGGHGGSGTAANAGGIYGSETQPIAPGSGGGGYNTGHHGSRGGGAIRLQIARRLCLDGVLTADGSRVQTHGGGSAGGSIYIRCKHFDAAATAALSARGGAASSPGGGGGGGRIAVWRTAGFTETTDVTGGGAPGTVYWGLIPATGTVLLLR